MTSYLNDIDNQNNFFTAEEEKYITKLAIKAKKRTKNKDAAEIANELYRRCERYIMNVVRSCNYLLTANGINAQYEDIYEIAIEIFIRSIDNFVVKQNNNFVAYLCSNLKYTYRKVLTKLGLYNKYKCSKVFIDDLKDKTIMMNNSNYINENLVNISLLFGDNGFLLRNDIINKRERDIIIMRHIHNETYKKIGEMYDLTKARIEQIDKQTIKKLNKYFKREKLLIGRNKPKPSW